MDGGIFRKLLLLSFLVAILSIAFIHKLTNLTGVIFLKKKHFLVIGILSAPENFEKRLSIRKTWLQLLPEVSSSYYFIVGNEMCKVPPLDRVDLYSCIDSPYILPQNVTQSTEFTTIKFHSSKGHCLDFIGFGFYVRKSVVVKKIGILKKPVENLNREVQVQLISAVNNNVLTSVTFSPEMLNDTDSEFLAKSIKTLSLYDNDEVILRVQTKNINKKFYHSCCFTTWQFEPNVLHFTHLWGDGVAPKPFTKNSCSLVFLTYNILDLESIRENTGNRTVRQKEWEIHNMKLSVQLENESQTYKDLLFVDIIDVYRNLSKKMIQFYKKVLEIENFHYILKVDDDSFIDLLRVYNHLKSINNKFDGNMTEVVKITQTEDSAKYKLSKFWWWSYFKEFWKVQRTGKWRDFHYQSASYPPFPCGGGYVINKAIVEYVVANEQNLHCFQGEDVSLGIWLSPLFLTHHKVPQNANSFNIQQLIVTKFGEKNSGLHEKRKINNLESDLCQWTCDNKKIFNTPLCNKVQLNVDDMYKTWNQFINNGFL